MSFRAASVMRMVWLKAWSRPPKRRLIAPNVDSTLLRRPYLAYQASRFVCSDPTICWKAVRVSGPSGFGGAVRVFFLGRMKGVAPAHRAAKQLRWLR